MLRDVLLTLEVTPWHKLLVHQSEPDLFLAQTTNEDSHRNLLTGEGFKQC